MRNNKKGFGKFVLGAGIGAALGLLFAPKKGSELREELKEKFDDLVNSLKYIDADDVKTTVEEKIEWLKTELENLDKETVLEEAKKQAKKLQDAAEELVEYAIEKGTPVVEKSANAIKEQIVKVSKQVIKKLETNEK